MMLARPLRLPPPSNPKILDTEVTGVATMCKHCEVTRLVNHTGPVHVLFTGRWFSVAVAGSRSVKASAALASCSGCAFGSLDSLLSCSLCHWSVGT